MRLAYLGLMATSVWLLRRRVERDAVVAAFVFGTTVACLEALQQAFANVSFRPDGNLGNANLLAALITMAVPLAIDRARRGGLFVGPWAASVVAMAAGLVVTTSRSGALGVIAGCGALLVLAVPRRFTVALAAHGWVLVVLCRAAWAKREERDVPALAAALVGYSVWVFFNFDWAPATAAFWLLAGTLWSSISLSPPGERAGVRGDKEVWRAAGAAGLVAAAVVFAVLPPLADT